MQIQNFGNQFNEVTIVLLENMPGNPCDWLCMFDTSKIVTIF